MDEKVLGEPLLQVDGLTVELPSGSGRFTAVNNVSFSILPGEVVAFVGESGSGKTATALSIMRLWGKESGEEIFGSAVLRLENKAIDLVSSPLSEVAAVRGKHLSMVFQDPMNALNPALRCGFQISEVVKLHLGLSGKFLKKKIESSLLEVGIQDPKTVMSKFPSQLSGGQLQRVLIAMALASDPQLLIADEPTTALDAAVRRKVLSELRSIQTKRNLSILLITHDLDFVQSVANRMVVMYAGKVVETGLVSNVFNQPQHPYTKGLISCRPPRSKRLYFLPTMEDFMRISHDGRHLQAITGLPEIVKGLEISPAERTRNHKKLYAQTPILKVNAIGKTYLHASQDFSLYPQRTRALRDVSFELFQGETLGLVGESGSGKTTLARCILGLESPSAGSVLFKTDQGEYAPFDSLKKIGHFAQYIFQDSYSSLDPRMTIGETLMEPLMLHRKEMSKEDCRSRVLELMAEVGLKPNHFDKLPKAFSGGQRQRIAIARAVLMEPKIIFCDEPVSSLDASVQAQVLNLLNELKYEYNLSLVFISHDMNLVRYMSDRVMVMRQGSVVEIGEADDLYAHPKVAYTASLVND